VELLDVSDAIDHWKASGLDLTSILHQPEPYPGQTLLNSRPQDHGLAHALDQELLRAAAPALERGERVQIELPIRNTNRTVGTMLGAELTRRWGGAGLPDDTITVDLRGSAGQSFGAFVPRGLTLRLEGDANDYFGKGLSGGRLVVHPDRAARFKAEENVIAGNVVLYGATGGEAFIRGVVGERFCVRNSGALAVVEGVGDHGCEYMTGGRAVVLGRTGRNFGAGMSGGIAYVLDRDGEFPGLVNAEMVRVESVDDDDAALLLDAVSRHQQYTGSTVAAELLGGWDEALARFVKVMPVDYQRVLVVMREAKEEGLSEDDTLQRVMAASHG
jgi:glutamate synthase (NADPH/NADH) large chain